MAWNWKKLPVSTPLEGLVIRLNAMMGALERVLSYTEPRGVSASWNPGATLAAGTGVGVDVSVPDALPGDLVLVAFSVPFTSDLVRVYGSVKSAGVVRAVIYNGSGSAITLGPGFVVINSWRA